MTNQYSTTDISKYLKQKESNISKSSKKSKHKHQYEECLIQYNMSFNGKSNIHTSLSSYCTICGKIGYRFKEEKSIVTDYLTIINTPIGKCYQLISDEKLYEEYHTKLPVFFVEDMFSDYVCINHENEISNGE